MNHLSAWIAKQEDTERDCEALGGIVHDTKIPIAVDAMIRIIGTQDTSYLPWKNMQRDETRQKWDPSASLCRLLRACAAHTGTRQMVGVQGSWS